MKLAAEHTQIQHKSQSRRPDLRRWFFLITLFALLLLAILLAVSFGSIAIPINVILQILLNGTGLFHFPAHWDSVDELIIWRLRMPGVMGALFVGAALSVAGVLFQGILRNPLADPFLIGTSSGAALGATLAFVLPVSTIVSIFPFLISFFDLYGTFSTLTPLLAFIGAILTVLFVYTIARTDGQTPVVTLLLAGVVMNAVLVACQTLILSIIPHGSFDIAALFNWLSGGVSVVGWTPVVVVGCITLLALALSMLLSGVLDAFTLGEEGAAHLGLHIERYKLLIIAVASLLTATAVSISGLIGFVGLVTPHVMRLLFGPRHRFLLPASALGGAIFLVLADLLARFVLAPTVLPVGIFTALVGAPFFLFLLRTSKRTYRW